MKINNFRLPMSDQLLDKFNFFELYPFDGGGNFINAEIVGAIDDATIVKNIFNGALEQFGKLPDIDHARFEHWGSIEKSCWINRCYFLVPLAKHYRQTKDEKIARLVIDIMLNFIRNYPSPQTEQAIKEHVEYVFHIRDTIYNKNTYEENQKDRTDVRYIWFDFQPASRIIHFLYALHFICGSNSLTETECAEIEAGIRDHARVIAISESKFEQLKSPGNHQSIRGLALLYAGTCFEDPFFLNEGIRICKFHIENDFFPDGVLKEISPSYHVFETWHVRDAFLLARNYGFNISGQHEAILRRAADFTRSIQQPDGCSTVIDDGYALNLTPFLASLPENLQAASDNEVKTFYFANAQLGFYRDDSKYVCFDASLNPGEFSHYHAGKAGITYFHAGEPILTDSGCCSYDAPEFSLCKKASAHSSLLIDGAGDGVFEGLYFCPNYTTPECTDWNDNEISALVTSTVKEWNGVTWNRTLKIEADCVIISDRIENTSQTAKEYCFILNLHPDVKIETLELENALLKTIGQKLSASFTATEHFELKTASGIYFDNTGIQDNSQILIKIKTANNFTLKTAIR